MATVGNKQGGGSFSKPHDQELEPRYEWQENDSSFILRVYLSGFRKEDFRVQVNGSGRLTVRGQRSDAGANARHSRVSKVFQLPATSDLDNVSGRFEAGVLTLTVPKRHPVSAAAAAGDAKAPPPAQEQEQEQAQRNQQQLAKKPQQDATAASKKHAPGQQAPDAKMSGGRPEPEQQQQQHKAAEAAPPPPAPPAASATEEEGKPNKAVAAAPAPATDTKTKQVDTPKPAPPPPQAETEKKSVDPESLAEMVKRRAAEESKAAAEAEAEAERQRKASRGFKERVAEELQGLASSDWAEGLVDTVKNNREVIAAAIAAFSLGVFVSSRIFSRSSRN